MDFKQLLNNTFPIFGKADGEKLFKNSTIMPIQYVCIDRPGNPILLGGLNELQVEDNTLTAKLTILVLTLFIYVLIVAAFNRARVKYSGGKVGDVINLILITVVLMFLGDYVLLLEPYLEDNILFTLQTLFRTTALSFLAYGGARIAGR